MERIKKNMVNKRAGTPDWSCSCDKPAYACVDAFSPNRLQWVRQVLAGQARARGCPVRRETAASVRLRNWGQHRCPPTGPNGQVKLPGNQSRSHATTRCACVVVAFELRWLTGQMRLAHGRGAPHPWYPLGKPELLLQASSARLALVLTNLQQEQRRTRKSITLSE